MMIWTAVPVEETMLPVLTMSPSSVLSVMTRLPPAFAIAIPLKKLSFVIPSARIVASALIGAGPPFSFRASSVVLLMVQVI